MNKYKMQYIVEVVRSHPAFPDCLESVVDPADLLPFFGFSDLLNTGERLEVTKEILELAEAARFKEVHQLQLRL